MSEKRPNVFGVSRSIWAHPVFDKEPFTQREAWLWLVGAAAWKGIQTRGNAGMVMLKRGEFSFAVRFLADKWQWSKSRVDRFIQTIENQDMIRDTSRDGSKIYSISKYNEFQVVGIPKRDSDQDTLRDDVGTAAGQQRDKEETGETLNRETEEVRITPAVAVAPHPKPKTVSRETPKADLFELPPIPTFLDRSRALVPLASADVVPLDPLERAVAAYNAVAEFAQWPICQRLNPARTKALRARLAECGGIQGWTEAMARAAQSSFLLGKTGRGGDHAQWRPDFDFILQSKSFTKLMEGGYDDAPGNTNSGSGLDRIAEAARYAHAQGDPDQRTA